MLELNLTAAVEVLGRTLQRCIVGLGVGRSTFWVAVKELKLSYHNGISWVYIALNMVSPLQ